MCSLECVHVRVRIRACGVGVGVGVCECVCLCDTEKDKDKEGRATKSLFVQITAKYNKQSVTFKQNTSHSMYFKPQFMALQGQKTETF